MSMAFETQCLLPLSLSQVAQRLCFCGFRHPVLQSVQLAHIA
jgi:hypothetical protein